MPDKPPLTDAQTRELFTNMVKQNLDLGRLIITLQKALVAKGLLTEAEIASALEATTNEATEAFLLHVTARGGKLQ